MGQAKGKGLNNKGMNQRTQREVIGTLTLTLTLTLTRTRTRTLTLPRTPPAATASAPSAMPCTPCCASVRPATRRASQP